MGKVYDYKVITGTVTHDLYPNRKDDRYSIDGNNRDVLGVQVREALNDGWAIFGKPQSLPYNRAAQTVIKRTGTPPVPDWNAQPLMSDGTHAPSLHELVLCYYLNSSETANVQEAADIADEYVRMYSTGRFGTTDTDNQE